MWEHSSAGRASALQAEGHRFEPCCSHHTYGPVVQLVRTLACHARGRGFEPHSGRQMCASVAQSVEQGTENPRVVGSIPTGGTTIKLKISGFSSSGRAPPCQGGGSEFEPRNPLHKWRRLSQVVRQRSAKPLFTSSNLVGASTKKDNREICCLFILYKFTFTTKSCYGKMII